MKSWRLWHFNVWCDRSDDDDGGNDDDDDANDDDDGVNDKDN